MTLMMAPRISPTDPDPHTRLRWRSHVPNPNPAVSSGEKSRHILDWICNAVLRTRPPLPFGFVICLIRPNCLNLMTLALAARKHGMPFPFICNHVSGTAIFLPNDDRNVL